MIARNFAVSPIINVVSLIFLGIVLSWYLARLGAALKIPLFVKWRNHLVEKERIQKQRCSISFDADTIALVDLREPKRNPLELKWSEIDRLTVFKRDLFTVDLICLCADFAGDKEIELDEDMPGWNALIDVLPTHLLGCKQREDWFATVAYPPFAPNPTEIYRRQTSPTA